jgi:colanic acid/amylovoran biosynthesis glycosyltransferase
MMRVGYFINQYPAATHSFIRREILALETMGVSVSRYALRSRAKESADPGDQLEEKKTTLILQTNIGKMLLLCLEYALSRPKAFGAAIREAVRLGRRSDIGVIRHLIYFVEAVILADLCRRDNITHIHAHFGTNSTTIVMLAKYLSNIPYSFTIHGPEEFDRPESLSLGVKIEHSAFVACVSSFGRGQLMRWSPPDQWRKIEVVHCGVDSAFLSHSVQPPATAPRLVCVGRLDAQKGQMILIRAAQMLRDTDVSCEIVVVGDGPLRKPIETAIAHAGLHNTIRLIGWASGDRVKEEMIAARALVLPSFAEGLPVVIMEAMALGRPVISTYVAGIPELVIPGQTGWLVPASDEIALSEAMRDALEAPADKLEKMGAAARERALERHDVMKEAAKLKRLFETSKG